MLRLCPVCNRPLLYASEELQRRLFPFCQERCKLIDLGAWMGEQYRVPAQTPPDAVAQAQPDPDEE